MQWRPLACFILAVAPGAACAAFGSEPAASIDAGASAPSDERDILPDEDGGGSDPFSPTRGCDDGGLAFCDDFESEEPIPRGWGDSTGLLTVAQTGIGGSRGLSITVPKKEEAHQYYLRQRHGGTDAGAKWQYQLSFAANPTPSSRSLRGPRLVTQLPGAGSQDDRRVDITIAFNPGAVVIDGTARGCLQVNTCGPDIGAQFPVTPGWHRYLVEVDVDVGAPALKRYGTVRFSVDGVVKLTKDLPYPLAHVTNRSTYFGISYAAAGTEGSLVLDDAHIELTEL